jgi:Na+/proline symporter
MKKAITTFVMTMVLWFLIVALYGYWYISDGIAHPEALNRNPVDMEVVALQRDPRMQLIDFALLRFPFLFLGLVVVVLAEIMLSSRGKGSREQYDRLSL